MDSTNCEQGDRSILTSSLMSVTDNKILQFAYYTNFKFNDLDAQFMVGVFYTREGLITDPLLIIEMTDRKTSVNAAHDSVTRMQPRNPNVNGWKQEAILLPNGTYYIGFQGRCGLPYESNIAVDDILMWTANPNDLLLDGKTKLESLSRSSGYKVDLPVGECKIFIVLLSLLRYPLKFFSLNSFIWNGILCQIFA